MKKPVKTAKTKKYGYESGSVTDRQIQGGKVEPGETRGGTIVVVSELSLCVSVVVFV